MHKLRLVLAAGLLLGPSVLASADDQTRSEISKIFDAAERPGAGGKPSPTAAYLRLGKLKPAAEADPRVRYAFFLGLVHCKKSKEALAYVSDLVKSHPQYLPARLARTRLLLRDRKFDEAVAELEAVGEQLARQRTSAELTLEVESSCRLLGLAFGYLEGPGKSLVKETLGGGIKQRVLRPLSTECRKVFDEQYQMVQAEHRELTTNGEKAFEELRSKNQAISQEADQQCAKLAAEQQKAETEAEQVKARLRAAWDTAYSQYAKAGESFMTVRAELVSLGNQRALTAGQLATLFRPVPDKNGRVDPSALRVFNQQMSSLQSAVAQLDQQIARNQVALERAWQQGTSLETQLSQLIHEGERLGERFELQKQDFSKEGKRIKTAPKSKKPPAFRQREQSFTTYDDFNLALEKQRLLASTSAAP